MGGIDKIFASLGGQPVLMHTLKVFQDAPAVAAIVVVLSESNVAAGQKLVDELGESKIHAVLTGGRRRQDSARVGVKYLSQMAAPPAFIAIHDGPRPFIDEALIDRGLEAVGESGAAVPGVPVTDTIKVVDDRNRVIDTPIRDALRAVQTPQIFERELIARAHAEIKSDVTDDAMMVEMVGGKVVIFEGSPQNIKITKPEDLIIAEQILSKLQLSGGSSDDRLRWGTGFDGHALKPGAGLRLGGIDIEFDHSLEGHSDGDVLLHAISSALLGAAKLGDLGTHFPSSSSEWSGIDSAVILESCLGKVRDAGWGVDYVDATIVAQRPRLGIHLERMVQRIAQILGTETERINIKVTSTDHVGAIGQGEGIAAQAIATLRLLS
jgi:2-C-methyl-D-erythritol 4-phosphate cytidylyltransferase/2-C-methyl-D-erythritol 2,4-cyclodiphosphate synthase